MSRLNIINLSGGKDSTATLLLAMERGTEHMRPVFCDTGHEHEQTYQYLDYLEQAVGLPIRRVSGNFRAQIAKKREYIVMKWAAAGVPQSRIDRALEVLVPTGNPFLDLCLWKGRFPNSVGRFCTEELKLLPIMRQVILPACQEWGEVYSWIGVRRDESRARANALELERGDAPNYWLYRPILDWTAMECFEIHQRHGIDWNPLYQQGMSRVGCMPCVMARKSELAEIARRFPAEVERVRAWERLVSEASKGGSAILMDPVRVMGASRSQLDAISYTTHGIDATVQWAKTTRGGKQFDLLADAEDVAECSSIYGLCA